MGIAEWAAVLWVESYCGDYDSFKEKLREAMTGVVVAWEITSKETGQIYVSRHDPDTWDSGGFKCRPLVYGD